MKIRKGDKVQVIKGRDRLRHTKKGAKSGKANQGKVIQVLLAKGRVVVEGLNLRYKHVRPKKEGEKGQRVQFPASMRVENVQLVCPKCHQVTRIGFNLLKSDLKDQKKIRVCRKCHEAID